jgi:hypothetical protein
MKNIARYEKQRWEVILKVWIRRIFLGKGGKYKKIRKFPWKIYGLTHRLTVLDPNIAPACFKLSQPSMTQEPSTTYLFLSPAFCPSLSAQYMARSRDIFYICFVLIFEK